MNEWRDRQGIPSSGTGRCTLRQSAALCINRKICLAGWMVAEVGRAAVSDPRECGGTQGGGAAGKFPKVEAPVRRGIIHKKQKQSAGTLMARFDSGIRYDTGVRYDAPEAPPAENGKPIMKKSKLSLGEKDNETLAAFARAHGAAVEDPANGFTEVRPPKAEFDAAVDRLVAATLARRTVAGELLAAQDEETAARVALETMLRARASYVDGAARGDPQVIHKAGLDSSAGRSPAPQLTPPLGLRGSLNGHSGQLRLRWKPVSGARTYLADCREDSPAPGPWQQVKVCTAAGFTASGLVPGRDYAFRVRPVGSAGEGPWSDVYVRKAA